MSGGWPSGSPDHVRRDASAARASSAKHDWLGSIGAVLGVIAVLGISALVAGWWGFLHVQPHPLWIVVLAIAIRYGAPTGYVAGGAAALGWSLLDWFGPAGRGQACPEHALVQPFLFLAVAVVVSHAIQGQRQRRA